MEEHLKERASLVNLPEAKSESKAEDKKAAEVKSVDTKAADAKAK